VRALTDKELRELVPPAVFILAIATVLGTLDLVYNWRQDHCLGISLTICLIAAFGIAFLGGANALARETREQMTFLASWPMRRETIWLIKLALNLGVSALTVALSFAICLVIVRMDGYDPQRFWRPIGVGGLWMLAGIWLGCYALAFFWSALVRIPMAAAGLGSATAALFAFGLGYLVVAYLPDRWGPWLGFDPDQLSASASDSLMGVVAVAVALVAFGASAAAFVRSPVLEAKRRAIRGMGWLLGLALALIVLSLATYWGMTRPSLTDVTDASLDRDGRYVLLWSNDERPGVWVADLDRGKPRLVARGAAEVSTGWNGGARFLILWGKRSYRYWSLDLRTGSLRREREEVASMSPSGRLQCTVTQGGVRIEDENGKVVRVYRGEAPTGQPIFSRDERYLYMVILEAPQQVGMAPAPAAPMVAPHGPPPRPSLLVRLDLATGEPTIVAHLASSPRILWLSPGGSHAAIGAERGLVLIDLGTGRQRAFPAVYPAGMEWVGDDRYLWGRELPTSRKTPREFHVLDAQAVSIARRIGPREMQAAAGSALPAWEAAQQSVLVAQPQRDGGPIFFASRPVGSKSPEKLLWAANVDGAGLRFLRRESRPWLGVAATGELVFWERSPAAPTHWGSPAGPNKIVLLDPSTGRERVLFSSP
jgi:hypothetical protein